MAFLTLAAPLLFLLLQLPQQVQLADDLQGGQAMWLDPTSHSVENTGTEDVTAVLFELKK